MMYNNPMKTIRLQIAIFGLVFLSFFGSTAFVTHAQTIDEQAPQAQPQIQAPQPKFYRAVVTDVQNSKQNGQDFQLVKARVLEADLKNQTVDIEHGKYFALTENLKITKGEKVALVKVSNGTEEVVLIADKYRLNYMLIAGVALLLLTVILTGFRGFVSLLGLTVGLFILIFYITPQLISGFDPVRVILLGGLVIIAFCISLTNGFNKQTLIASVASLLTFSTVTLLTNVFLNLLKLNGMGSKEAFLLQSSQLAGADLKGLLLGGMVFGVLGALSYISCNQANAVNEMKKAKTAITIRELFMLSLKTGREHVMPLISVLVLAYVSLSLPLFIIFKTTQGQPFWFVLNSELFIEEIIRVLAAVATLALALPVTSFLSAYVVSYKKAVNAKN